jgi:MFS-type transporter involved in bile tolerance (Atg22 family)
MDASCIFTSKSIEKILINKNSISLQVIADYTFSRKSALTFFTPDLNFAVI